MLRLLVSAAALLWLALPAAAQCTGANLVATLAPQDRAALDAAVEAQPYPRGNLWRATRAGAVLHLVGTYHFDDPRHSAAMDRLRPLLAESRTLLVEAGPEEEAALKAEMARNPSVMLLTDGPTLPEQLSEPEWQALASAMRARGIPPFLAAKFQPWYVSLVLGVPACAMAQAQVKMGLDAQLIAAAAQADVPVRALEPFDTVLSLFDGMSNKDQLGMIRSTLPLEKQAADYSVTLADAYFAEESRQIWEFMRLQARVTPGYDKAQSDAEFAMMEEALMSSRNRAWVPVIEAALDDGPALAAFGALHLPGHDGILALLERAGFTLERLPFQPPG